MAKVTRTKKRLYEEEPAPKKAPAPKPAPAPSESTSTATGQAQPASKPKANKRSGAEKIVSSHLLSTTAVSLLPIPFFDTGSSMMVQLNMLRQLCDHYGVSFTAKLGKMVLSPVMMSLTAMATSHNLAANFLKMIPGPLGAGGYLSAQWVNGVATYAAGHIFIEHFEGGGTLLDIDAEQMTSRYFKSL